MSNNQFVVLLWSIHGLRRNRHRGHRYNGVLAKFTAKDDQPGDTSDHSSKKSKVEPFGHAPSDLV